MNKRAKLNVAGGIWLTRGSQPLLGDKRIALLEAIRIHGSITQAAKAIKMSYKAAWDTIDAGRLVVKTQLSVILFSTTLTFAMGTEATEPATVTVFAAASLTNALDEINAGYEQASARKVVPSYSSSSTLAKQIENGAPADVFISADEKWMDYLAEKRRIDLNSRHDLLGNTLVLVAPKGKHPTVTMDPKFKFAATFGGKLCTGDPERVPVGIYAKHALQHLGWWEGVATRIVPADDVRAALLFVERNECDFGIVYESDTKVSSKVETVATFPETSHEPIRYPVAKVSGDHQSGSDYLQYLSSKEATAVFKKYGFRILDGGN